VTVSSPRGAALEEQEADPEDSAALHSVVLLTEKVTPPDGVGPDPLTVAE
jgi:hypothetical protein